MPPSLKSKRHSAKISSKSVISSRVRSHAAGLRSATELVICTNAPARLGAMQIRDKEGGGEAHEGFEVKPIFLLEIGDSKVCLLL